MNSTNLIHTKDWNQVMIAWTLSIQSSIILLDYYLSVCTHTVSLISQRSNQILIQTFYLLFNIHFSKFLLWPAKIYLASWFLNLTANHLSEYIILILSLILYFLMNPIWYYTLHTFTVSPRRNREDQNLYLFIQIVINVEKKQ